MVSMQISLYSCNFRSFSIVSSTNNAAESSQRGVKIKQKVGKFRSVDGANNYLIIKSCILTCKKQKIDILKSINKAFNNQSIFE